MSICPNKNLPEWKALVANVGNFEAFKDFMETHGEIRSPEVVSAKIKARTSNVVYQLSRTGPTGQPVAVEVMETLIKNLAAKFGEEYGYRIDYSLPEGTDWKGKVEPANDANGNKPTVVINGKLATLDTPLHEFGHIFLNLIKAGNMGLYSELIAVSPFDTEAGKKRLTDLTAANPTMKLREVKELVLEEMIKAGEIEEFKSFLESSNELFKIPGAAQVHQRIGVSQAGQSMTMEELRLATVLKMLEEKTLPQYKAWMQKTSVFSNPAYQKELEAVRYYYKDKGLTEIELREEAIVELLGKLAAGEIDPQSGLYKAINNIWEAIKQIFKDMMGLPSKTDVLDIRPDASIEALANMLAHKDIFITTGKQTKIKRDKDIDSALQTIKTQKENLAKLAEIKANTPDNIHVVNAGIRVLLIDSEVNAKLEKLKDKLPVIKSYLLGLVNESMQRDIDELNKVFMQGMQKARAEGKSSFVAANELWDRFMASDKYPKFKFFVKNDQGAAVRIKEQMREFYEGRLSIERASEQFMNYIEPLKDKFVYNTTDDLIYTILKQDSSWLRGIFGNEYKALAAFTPRGRGRYTSFEAVVRDAEQALDNAETDMRNIYKGLNRRSRPKKIKIKFDNGKGQTEFDTIEVSTQLESGVDGGINVYVAFESENWRYSDPVWAMDYAPDMNLRLGKDNQKNPSEFRIKTDRNLTKQGVIMDIVDGYALVKFGRGGGHAIYPPIHEGLSKVPLDQIQIVNDQNRMQVLPKVIEAINELHFDVNFTSITFSAAAGASSRRDVNEMRKKVYTNWAVRLFGQNFAGVTHTDRSTIFIPAGFRDGLIIDKELYQVDRANTSEVPFGSEKENSLLGQAVAESKLGVEVNDQANSHVLAVELANKMSQMLGVEYEMISAKDAEIITKDAQNPWNGEAAFFVGGKVYFVGDRMNANQTFHEFAHPFVRALAAENPLLFHQLFDQLANTPEGREIIDHVKENYDLDPEGDMFKEEVIVRALTKSGMDKLDNIKEPTGFAKVMKNIMYALKQFIRRVFGKNAAVSKLSPSTTLEDLADMLVKGDKIQIDTTKISQEDVVAYEKDRAQYIDDITNIDNAEIQALVNRMFDISAKHIDTLLGNKNYEELAAILTDEFKRGDLQEMKSRVQEYQSMVHNLAEDTKKDMEYIRKRASALVDSMFRLEVVMEKVLLHMQDIAEDGDTQDNMHKAYYYDYLVSYWEGFIKEANEAIDDPKNGIPNNSPLTSLIGNISRSISRVKALTNELYADGARDTLYDQLAPMNESIKARYERMIENMEKHNASPKRIDGVYKEYYGVTKAEYQRMKALQAISKQGNPLSMSEQNELRNLERSSAIGIAITPEKIEQLLKGEMGDANFFNSYLEGYLYNTDPIIGGLALYVKNQMNEVMSVAQSKFNDFATDMKPLLEKAGYNPTKIGKLGEDIGFVDKISQRDENGALIEKEVWTMLNPFKNYRYDYDRYKDDVDKATHKLSQTGSDQDRKALAKVVADRQTFMRKYFHQEYVPQYYERQALFEKDDIGIEAMNLRKNLFERMRMLTEPATTQTDYMQIADELDDLWREYRQLHSEFQLNGDKKTGDELEIALRLKQYRDDSRDFYEWKQRKGIFENSLKAYEQELIDAGTDDAEFKVLREEWIRRNTKTVVKQEFYERRQAVITRISEIMEKLPDTERRKLDESGVWNDIFDLTAGFRDDNGQPDASAMDVNSVAKVKRLQEELIKLRENYIQRNGLTRPETARLSELHQYKADRALTADESAEMRSLYDKKSNFGLDKWDKAELDSLYEELQQLSKREATEYYADTINDWLSKLNTDKLFTETGSRSITRLGADKILGDTAILNDLFDQSPEFEKWFRTNHLQKESWDKDSGETRLSWERLYVWSVVRPTNPNYMETYDIKDANGQVIETIQGVPASKYFARVVKPEFRTKRIVGTTVDNKGNWLPKTKDQGAADDRYINQEYYDLEKTKPDLFNVLEKLKEHHLKNQEGLGYKSRLYMDFPRFRKSNLETLQTTNIKGAAKAKANAITIWAQRVRDFFRQSSEQDQEGLNYKEEFNLIRADMFDNEVTSVPIAGLYNTELQDVSTDITHSMMRYMLSAERQKQLVKISPAARAIKAVVNDPKNAVKELDKINKFNFIHRGIRTYMNKKGAGVRARAVNNFIEREFEGQKMTGAGSDVAWLNNTANLLFKRASFSFFALNIPSALKNSYGAKFQGMIEASAGKYMNHISFQKGNGWSYGTMAELSFGGQLYNKGPKSHKQQLVDIFDPSQGRFEEKFGENMSRTIAKDAASMSWLYNFRKWVELQATLQIFGGMMYHQKVEMTDEQGNVKEIPYMDAWETIDGKIQLKKGIDPKWGITYSEEGEIQVGKEFSRFKNLVHQSMNNMQGAYASFDQPEAQRYLAFRFLSYLRRYFTTMTMNRFGFSGKWFKPQPRLNPGMGDAQLGFYVEFLRTLKNTITSLGRNLMYMTAEEKRAALKVITEVGALIVVNMLMGVLFGWDPDDDDKYAKLRERSGALPFPFVSDQKGREFDGWGFMENHALMLLMNVRAENEQFIPLPGYGLDDYTAMLDLKSIAFGPTVQTYKTLFEDAINIYQGDASAKYTRDVGPYTWQREGSNKIWAHLGSALGVTGSSLDPAKAIKGFQSVQARAR